MKNTPNTIYLNLFGGEDINDFKQLTGVTWSTDKINDSDIEYIRVEKSK